jgi:aspartate/methionine/tyrosine aminotransferase
VLDLPDELLRRTVVVTAVGSPGDGLGAGVSLAPQAVAQAQARVQSWLGGSVPPANQAAVLSLLTNDRHAAERDGSAEGMRRKRDAAVEFLRVRLPGVEFIDPLGGLFVFVRIEGAVLPELEHADRFCEALLSSTGVALAPGTAFGDHRWVRLTFAVPDRQLDQGLSRLEEFVHANALETTR